MAGEVTVSRTSLILAGALVVAVVIIATMATAILAGGGDDKAAAPPPLPAVATASGSVSPTATATPSAALTATPTPTAETPTSEPAATPAPTVATVAPTTRPAAPIPTAVPPTPTPTSTVPYNAEEKALYNNWRAAQNKLDRQLTYEQALTDAAWRRAVADIKASVDALVTYFGGPRPFGYVDNTPRTTCESDIISLGLTGQTWAVLVTWALDRQKTSDNPPLGFSSWEKYWENSWDASATLAFPNYSAAAAKVPVSCPSIAS